MLPFGLSSREMPEPDWTRALALAKPGSRYRISGVVFAIVRDRCRELGVDEGDEVECVDNRSWALELRRPDGQRVVLERDYAWFVQAEFVDGSGFGPRGESR